MSKNFTMPFICSFIKMKKDHMVNKP